MHEPGRPRGFHHDRDLVSDMHDILTKLASIHPEIDEACSDRKLIERAVLEHAEAVLDFIRPHSARDALALVMDLTAALRKGDCNGQ